MKTGIKALLLSTVLEMILLCANTSAQVTEVWANRYNGGANLFDDVSDLQVDNSGNVYVTGTSKEPGTGQDIVTIRYNSAGTVWWLSKNHVQSDISTGIEIDPSNPDNIYVCGIVSYPDFSTAGVLYKYNSSGGMVWNKVVSGKPFRRVRVDLYGNIYAVGNYVIKYNSFGTQLWSVYTGLSVNQVILDASSNIYITGQFGSDIGIVKVTSSGSLSWSRTYSTTGTDRGMDVALDASNNVYVTGSAASGSSSNNVTIKYNNAGTQQWVKSYSGAGYGAEGRCIEIDNAGYIIIGGTLRPSVSGLDYHILKYDSYGTQIWSRIYNSPLNDEDFLFSMDIDASRNIYVSGHSLESGIRKMTTLKYNSSGTLQWTAKYGNSTYYNNNVRKVVHKNGNVYVGGLGDNASSNFDYITIKYSQSSGRPGLTEETGVIPESFRLYDNYPNPFNPSTKIRFDIPSGSNVRLAVYDMLGREVDELLNEYKDAGHYEVNLDASAYSGGVYFYKLLSGEFTETKKMILVK